MRDWRLIELKTLRFSRLMIIHVRSFGDVRGRVLGRTFGVRYSNLEVCLTYNVEIY